MKTHLVYVKKNIHQYMYKTTITKCKSTPQNPFSHNYISRYMIILIIMNNIEFVWIDFFK